MNVEDHPASPLAPTKQDDRFGFLVFFCLGASALLPWNCFLAILPSLLRTLYSEQDTFTDTATATYFTVICIFTLVFTVRPITQADMLFLALCGILLHLAAIPLMCSFVPASAISIVFHFYSGFVGLFVAMTVCGTIAVASTLPKLQVIAVASGMGFPGLLTFIIWLVTFHGVIQDHSPFGTLRAIWILYSFALSFVLISLGLFVAFIKRPWLQNLFKQQGLTNRASLFGIESFRHLARDIADGPYFQNDEQRGAEAPSDTKKTYDTLGLRGIMRATWISTTIRFLIFFQTMFVFPNIGPVAWMSPLLVTNLCIGGFQLFDFLGRFLPHMIRFLRLRETVVAGGLLVRIALVVLIIVTMTFRNKQLVFSNASFQIALIAVLAFTNGWFSTLATAYLPSRVQGSRAKAVASSFGVAVAFFGVVAGQWTSKLVKVILEPTNS